MNEPMKHDLVFDADMVRRYDLSGPRYTSYPTAIEFHDGFGAPQYREWVRRTNAESIPRPLSLYFHIPFCSTVCYYCACNKIITKNRSHAVSYLEHLYKEIQAQGRLFDRQRTVDQLHWGGGTPTFLHEEQMEELMSQTAQNFKLRDDDKGEYSIEIDPRQTTPQSMAVLRRLGFNRISLGVQDYDPLVQKAVNRIQSEEETMAVVEAARDNGFRSLSIDLIYGLPHQTRESFARTLDRIVQGDPDRLSVFNYAHLPQRFKTQRQINAEELPAPAEKLAILQLTIERLLDAGYVYIGMDHFAKPDDELAAAQRERKLYRNFQGYSTHDDCDLVAMGISAISSVGDCYSQNVHTLEEYYERIDREELPIIRGVELGEDDKLRQQIIRELICHFSLATNTIEDDFDIDFSSYFATEIEALRSMESDGLLRISDDNIQILPKGRLLIRSICMVFDHYRQRNATAGKFSRLI